MFYRLLISPVNARVCYIRKCFNPKVIQFLINVEPAHAHQCIRLFSLDWQLPADFCDKLPYVRVVIHFSLL
jgi:hypothetical protein